MLPMELKLTYKRNTIRTLIEKHSYSRREARAAYSQITDKQIEEQSQKCGVLVQGFQDIIQWIKDNWLEILKVVLSIVGIILLFVKQPPNAINVEAGIKLAHSQYLPEYRKLE